MASKKKVQNQEKAEKEKKLLLAKERILETKRNILSIVEMMLEKDISCEWFLQNCGLLSQDDYQDVIHERSIDHICGYPLCNKKVTEVPKQQYKISLSLKKVFDQTDRKCFCSNECYSASKFVKLQLAELPLYMRKNEDMIQITLLEKGQNKGKPGDEIVFERPIAKESDLKEKETRITTNYMADLLKKEVADCAEQLKSITVTEKVIDNKKPYVFNPKPSKTSPHSSDSSSDAESDEEDNIFPDYEDASTLMEKYMPIPKSGLKKEVVKKAKMIDPLRSEDNCSPAVKDSLPVEFFYDVFQDWFTISTLSYLLGETKVHKMQSDLEIQNTLLSRLTPKDLQPDTFNNSPNSSSDVKRIPKRRPKSKDKKEKSMSFSAETKVKDVTPVSEKNDSTPEPILPLVPSISQNALRKQIVLEKLKAVYLNVFPPVGLYYQDISENVNSLVETFRLTPTNVTYKPNEWKCIALVLLKILTNTKLKEFHNEEKLRSLHKLFSEHTTLTLTDLDKLSLDLVNMEQLKKLKELPGSKANLSVE